MFVLTEDNCRMGAFEAGGEVFAERSGRNRQAVADAETAVKNQKGQILI